MDHSRNLDELKFFEQTNNSSSNSTEDMFSQSSAFSPKFDTLPKQHTVILRPRSVQYAPSIIFIF